MNLKGMLMEMAEAQAEKMKDQMVDHLKLHLPSIRKLTYHLFLKKKNKYSLKSVLM